MALDTVTSILAGLRNDDATLRLIRDRALATSAIERIRIVTGKQIGRAHV